MILRASQYASGPNENEWRFLALVIQPDGLFLREWDADAVTELGGVAVPIPQAAWHTVTIDLGGEDDKTVTVKQLREGAGESDSFEAATSLGGDGDYGFGVGESAQFRFDDVSYRNDITGPSVTTALRYHYDANGRVVGRTLNPGGFMVLASPCEGARLRSIELEQIEIRCIPGSGKSGRAEPSPPQEGPCCMSSVRSRAQPASRAAAMTRASSKL